MIHEALRPRDSISVNELPRPEQVRHLYERYYTREPAPDRSVSSHWRALGPRVDVRIDADGNIVSFKGYGFGDLQYRDPVSRVLSWFCNLSYFVRLPFKKDLRFLLRKVRKNLKRLGTYVTYDCFRQTCGLCVVRWHLKAADDECFDVLIIGDGYGFLSSLIKSVYPNTRITLIDLGKILLFQAVDLQRIYPDCKHVLVGEGHGGSREFDFRYVPAEHYSALKDAKYKLIFNISSMQEMNYDSIRGYFNFIRANATEDSLFYCCNRARKELPGGEVIEFLNYPWVEKDEHLVDEYCPFVKYGAAAKWPFFHRFDGPFMHRLTNLATGV